MNIKIELDQDVAATLAEFLEPITDDGGMPEYVYKHIEKVRIELAAAFKLLNKSE